MARKNAVPSQAFPLVSMLALQCPLVSDLGPFIFAQIHTDTAGDPCTTGCAFFKKGACESYRKLVEVSPTDDDLKRAINFGIALIVLNAERVIHYSGGVITAVLFILFSDPLRPDGDAILTGIKRDFPGKDGDDFDFDALCAKILITIESMP